MDDNNISQEVSRVYDFGDVIKFITRRKGKAYRLGWNGANQYIYLKKEESAKVQPYIMFKTVNNTEVPWVASQTDLLSCDWVLDRVLDESLTEEGGAV